METVKVTPSPATTLPPITPVNISPVVVEKLIPKDKGEGGVAPR